MFVPGWKPTDWSRECCGQLGVLTGENKHGIQVVLLMMGSRDIGL